jgi:hypothetical protein
MEQLALVLTRAGSASLALTVIWPVEVAVDIGHLEFISSQKSPIRSLKISYNEATSFDISGFQNLNFSELQKLDFGVLPWDQSMQVMDLALQSRCRRMTLDLGYGVPTLKLFRHKLLEQVVDIGIATCQLYLP